MTDALQVTSTLPALTDDEKGDLTAQDRRAEEFLMYATGWTQTAIAKYFGVAVSTVNKDLKIESRRRADRMANIDEEIERIAGVMEGVISTAWRRHNEAAENNINSVAGSNYLKIVLEAAEKYAHLRGFDIPKVASVPNGGKTRVIVQIGGSGEQPQIAVGVES